MKAGQVITLFCALVLLLPGTCFGVVGVIVIADPNGLGWGFLSLLVAAVFFALVVWLVRVVIGWNRPPPTGPGTSAG
jgi:hypothetical protein